MDIASPPIRRSAVLNWASGACCGCDQIVGAEDAGAAVVGTGASGRPPFGDDRPASSNRDARSTAAHLPLSPVQIVRIPLQDRSVGRFDAL